MNLMKFFRGVALAIGASFVAATSGFAADKATKAEAEAMVQKAVAYVKSQGPDKAYEEITNGKMFKDRELYVLVFDFSGKMLAHGANPKLVGKQLIELKDPDGKQFNKMLIDLAKEKGKGWSEDFKFRNPVTDKIERRIVYVERLNDTMLGAGIFID